MDWSKLASLAEVCSAIAVLVTLIYLAIQIRDAKRAMSDQSRIYRASAINNLILASCSDHRLRDAQLTAWGMADHYRELAKQSGESYEEITAREFACGYYYWMWWGQYASSTAKKDREELAYIIRNLGGTPGMREHWEKSPVSRPLIDQDFARFVDGILGVGNPPQG